MANLTQTTLSDGVKTRYEQRLMIRAVPRLIHGRWAEKATLNKFGAHELRRYETLSAVTTALTEGTTPTEQSAPTLTLVTLTPSFYGAWLGYTDELEMTVYDPLVSEISGVLGEQAGTSADTLVRNQITANATKDYSGNQSARTSLDAPAHNITYQDFLKAYSTLIAANALPVMGDKYICVMHPHTYATLYNDPTFVNLFQHAGSRDDGMGSASNPMRSGYIGTILMCDIYVTSNAREYADGGVGNDDVYSLLFIGRESYGTTGVGTITPQDVDPAGPEGKPLTGAGTAAAPVKIIAKQLGSAGADDPLDQRATIGWKLALDTQVLNSSFIVDLEHTNDFSED